MPTVNIVREFTWQHPDGYKEVIPPGAYDMEDDMANSPIVRHYSDSPIRPQARFGTPQYISGMAGYQAAQGMASAVEEQVAGQAAMKARDEFRKSDKPPQARRPNQRRAQGEEQQEQQDHEAEMQQQRQVAEAMGQKLPDDHPAQKQQRADAQGAAQTDQGTVADPPA